MVITVQKPIEEILEHLKEQKIFLVGCAQCATICHSGGEPEVKEMKKSLEEKGKVIVDWIVLDPGCNLPKARTELRKKQKALDESESILVLSCGLGNQVLTEITKKIVHPGCNTLCIGAEVKTSLGPKGLIPNFEEQCSLCGECILETTGGICPLTRCSKGLLNGPCGGAKDGKCEVDKEKDCGWQLIYERLKELGMLELLEKFQAPKDWSKKTTPQKIIAGEGSKNE